MANGNVDERIVEMQFENQQFEKNANTTIGTLDKLKKSLNLDGAAKGFETLDAAAGSLDFTPLQNGVAAIGEKFTMMGILGITAMQRISNAAIDMGISLGRTLVGLDGISEGFSRYAEKSNHVKTIMTATKASIEDVSDVLDDLNWFTDETSYRFTDMVNTMGKFTSAGVELKTAKEAVEGIALWAAESGQNAATASRAMFQLAQAYGRGTIQLQDWMSVEQANMSTSKIMNELIAEGGKVAENAIAKYGGFRDSLRSGWLTTEIFNKVMQKYSEGITEANYENGKFTGGVTEMSKAAFAAAQEARTYKDAIDSVKEAVSTGWSQTFELLFGNAEEAAVVWTDLANTLIAVSDKFTSFRNDFLEVWNDLGGRDTVVSAAYNMMSGLGRIGNNLGKSWAQAMHFGKSLEEIKQEEWATSYEARSLIEEIGDLEDQLARMTANGDSIERLEEWRAKIDDVMGELNSMDRAHTLNNISEKLLKFSDSFKEMTHYEASIKRNNDRIVELKKILEGLGDGLDNSSRRKDIEEEIERLQKVNEGYAQFGKIWETAQKIWESFLTVLTVIREVTSNLLDIGSLLSRLFNPILNVGGAIAHLVTALGRALMGTGAIGDVVKDAGDTLESFFSPIIDFVAEKLEWLAEAIEKVADDIDKGVSPISGWLEKAREAISNFFKSLNFKAPELENSESIFAKIGKLFNSLWNTAGTIAEKLTSIVTNLWNVLTDIFGKIADLLSKFVDDFGKAAGFGDNIIDNIVIFISKVVELFSLLTAKWAIEENPIAPLADALYGAYYKFSGEGIKAAAQGLLYLAGALFVIASIDTDRLAQAAVVLEILMFSVFKLVKAFMTIDNMGSKLSFDKEEGTFSKIKKSLAAFAGGLGDFAREAEKVAKLYAIGLTLQKIGAAMLMLSGALFIIGQLKPEQMFGSIIVLAAVFKLLEGFVNKTKDITGFKTGGLIKMAVSLVIIAEAVKKLGRLSPEELGKGLGAMGAILLEIVGFQALIDKLGRMNLFGSDKGLTGIGLGMVFIATSMIVFAKALSSLGNLSVDELNQGLGAMAVILAALAAALFVLQKTPVIGIAVGFMILSVAIAAIAATIALLGQLKLKTIGKGLLGVVVSIAAITAALAILSDHTLIGVNLIASAVAITIVAAALNLLIVPIMAFSRLSFGQIVLALVALGGALLVIGGVATLLSKSSLAMVALGAALTLVGVGLSAIGIGLTLVSVSLVAAVGSIITSLDMIVAGLGTFIAAIVFAIVGSIDSIVLGIAVLGKAILDAVKMLIAPMLDLLGVFIDELIKFLVDHGPVLIYGVIKIVIDLLEAISVCLPEFIDAGLKLAIALIDGIARGIMENSEDTINAITNLVYSIVYLVLTAIEGLLRDIPVIGKEVSSGIDGIKSDIEGAMRDVGASATDGVDEGFKGATENAKGKGGDLIGGFIQGATESLPALDDLSGGIQSKLGEAFANTEGTSFGVDFLTNEKNSMLEMAPEFSEVGTVVDESIFSTTGGDDSQTVLGANGLFDGMMDLFNSRTPEVSAIGEDIDSNLVTGMDNKQFEIENKSQEIADATEEPISELPDKFNTHSTNAMQGLINGVDAMWNSVVGKFEALAAECDSKISNVWKEHSPSKVFEKHSENAMLGLENGVTRNSKLPINALNEVASVMADIIDNDDFSPVITPVLDLTNVEQGASRLDTLLASRRISATASGFGYRYNDPIATATNKSFTIQSLNVYGTENMDVNELSDAVIDKLNRQLASENSRWAY